MPYVAIWTGEQTIATTVMRYGQGIAYTDEIPTDRDHDGVLWTRSSSRPGQGRPVFTQLHPLRQRRAMRRLLCQVCAGPADYNDRGHLWLLTDRRQDWSDWPEGAANPYPPVCLACARLSVRLCPPLRRGFAVIRAHSTACGVIGVRFRPGPSYPAVILDNDDGEPVTYEDPAIRWMQATQLVRTLHDCTFVDLD
ncbi:MAG TPA: hypothetical protein VFX16_37830 [Pseudonocardiaceae bacterium]|nr:hypothetical protein [Pseudonocardiaceae bacterium]